MNIASSRVILPYCFYHLVTRFCATFAPNFCLRFFQLWVGGESVKVVSFLSILLPPQEEIKDLVLIFQINPKSYNRQKMKLAACSLLLSAWFVKNPTIWQFNLNISSNVICISRELAEGDLVPQMPPLATASTWFVCLALLACASSGFVF